MIPIGNITFKLHIAFRSGCILNIYYKVMIYLNKIFKVFDHIALIPFSNAILIGNITFK
jgi:hypothetical protein